MNESKISAKVSEYLIKRIRKELSAKYIKMNIPKAYR